VSIKALVTGADGLLGANLVRELLSRGISVRAFIQEGSRSPTLDGLEIERVEGDLLARDEKLADAVRGCDAIFHCAAITDQWADPKLTWNVNMEGTRRVLDACVSAKVRRGVFTGSASSYQPGTKDMPGDETSPFPEEYRGVAYMESKHAAALLVREYVSEKGLDAVICCPTFMLGPYDARPSSGELIRQYVKRGMRFASPGGRNFAYVGDVAKAMANALERGRAGESYILGGQNLSYLEFFRKVAKAAGTKPPNIVVPKTLVIFGGAIGGLVERITKKPALFNPNMARFACMGTYYSSEKAIRELNMPQTPVDKAIQESIQSLKQYGHFKK
jgi:dihydroflavonol-4-reductase